MSWLACIRKPEADMDPRGLGIAPAPFCLSERELGLLQAVRREPDPLPFRVGILLSPRQQIPHNARPLCSWRMVGLPQPEQRSRVRVTGRARVIAAPR